MRLFRDGTLYYVTVVAVLLVTTIGATNQTMRPIVVGSGYHIASVSVGCSRLILSLHAWSEAQKQNPQTSTSPSTCRCCALAREVLQLQPPTSKSTGKYELKARRPSDIELAAKDDHARNGSRDTMPPPVPPKDREFQSIIPDIERPSLPERMWSTLPGAHARQEMHQYPRPPRSSSLYASGRVPDRLVFKTPAAPIKEGAEPWWTEGQTADMEQQMRRAGPRRYNVI
ncbi:hypothetical protein FRC12_021601 [Ceratobasidium sp. 428]|nr:hypothetical protein FRC12_021601 [Ceratobasidium sp. 428]